MLFSEKWKQWKRRASLFADRPPGRRRPSQRPLLFLEPLEDRLVLSNGALAPVVGPSVAGLSPSSPSPALASSNSSAQSGAAPALSGTWTQISLPTTSGVGTMFLLPNGDVMAQGGVGTPTDTWYELQPDANGSYANGAWSQLASMSRPRLYFGSVVLGSDKVFVLGGEYSTNGGNQTFDNTGEIYNIATNTWSSIPNFPQSYFGDDPTDVLPNGDILAGYLAGPQTYLYNPATNSWSNGPTKLDSDPSDEETWIKLPASAALPQGGILSYSIFASLTNKTFMGQVYNIATNTWIETKNSTTNPPSLLSTPALGYELGGGLLLPNGKVFLIGANGNTALYDPSTNTWSAGPQVKDTSGNLCGADDAPASILPDGQVLFTADYGPTTKTFSPPTELFDYDYTTNTITQITNLPSTLSNDLTNNGAFIDRTLVLPSGQLLLNDGVNLFLFTPSDAPQNAWRPSISSIVKNSNGTYTLTGLQLSGISEGSSYGDDVNVSENYPIVQVTASNGQVYYATTSNWSNVGVSAVGDTTLENVTFTLPAGLANGRYQLTVIANGIASTPQTFVIGTAVTTTAQSISTPFSSNTQTLSLTANVNVVGSTQTVNEGTVTFTIKDNAGNTIGSPVQGAVSNGVASATYTLPANEPVGTYTIAVSYNDSANIFIDSSDTNGTLTITAAKVQTKANNIVAPYSPNAQTVTLTASVTDKSISTDTVSEGTVTFTVKNGSLIIGSATGTVKNGTASAQLTLPAGLALGSYTIAVNYSDSLGNLLDNGDTNASLSIVAANVVTTAANVTTAYSPNAQTVTLTANVTDESIPSDIINQGAVTFTVTGGGTTYGPFQAPVINGTAEVTLNLPAGLAPTSFTIAVSYSDSTGDFVDSGDVDGKLTIIPANVITATSNVSAIYSPNQQTLALHATVADASIATDTVNEGTVTFTVLNGSTSVGSVVAPVINGAANTTFTLPAGTPVGSYTLAVHYSDNTLGNFVDSGDSNATLTITPAHVATAANNVSAAYSPNTQTLKLSASITDLSIPTDSVNEGLVTFTLEDGSTIIGNASATVSNGTAVASFTWSAGRAAGSSYTIAVSYYDNQGNFIASSNTSGTLSIIPANVTTTANTPPTVLFSLNAQTVTLTANVADTSIPTDTVNEGVVTFTLLNGTTPVGTPVQSSVSNGLANAQFILPAGQAAGSYTVAVRYNDSAGNFKDTSDTPAILSITPANVTTTANNVTAAYSPNAQTVTLTARVADASIPSDRVNEGVVTFTLLNGTTPVGTPVQSSVSNGLANAQFTLPAGLSLGSYAVAVHYSDSAGNFKDTNDTPAILSIIPANVTTTANNVTTAYSPNTQTVTLTARVADASIPSDTVSEGVVTFTITNGTTPVGTPVQSSVSNGLANAQFTLPAGLALGSYTVAVHYSDSAGNFKDTSDTPAILSIIPANVTTTANNVTTAYSPNTQTVTLTARVADASIPSDTVSEGVVTFTITNGQTTLGSLPSNVNNGSASASFTLPAGQAAGTYTITVHYNDNSGHFIDTSDTPALLTLAPANVTTTANPVSASYSPNAQVLTLSAVVTDTSVPTDIVNAGSVTFTVLNGSTPLGSVSSLVSNGKASANFSLPAGQTLGNYTLAVHYNDSQGNFKDVGDANAILALKAANVTVAAANLSTFYNLNAQTVTLTAALTDASIPSDTVNEGSVTFTVLNRSLPVTVSNGIASATLDLPPGQAAGVYPITVSYSDGTGHFTDIGNNDGTLVIAPANVVTTAASINTLFSTTAQTVMLHAAVADTSNPSNTVSEGIVTFTVASGGTMIGAPVQSAVNSGSASAAFTLPAGLAAGNYTITVHYTDNSGQNNFTDVSDQNGTLSIGTAATSIQLVQTSLSPNYTNLTVTETVTAHVSSSTPVNRGAVTFVLSNQTITTNVDGNGNATAVVNLPMTSLLSPQGLSASYADPSNNLTASSTTETVSWQPVNLLLPNTTTFTPTSQVVTVDLNGLLVTFTNGVLTEIDFGSIHLVFSYNTLGQLIQVTLDGVNLLP
jgi:hypothetical protein